MLFNLSWIISYNF